MSTRAVSIEQASITTEIKEFFKIKDAKKLINDQSKHGETGCAELFEIIYKGRIICDDVKNKVFYYWNGNIWVEDKSQMVQTLVTKVVGGIIEKYKSDLELETYRNAQMNEDEGKDKFDLDFQIKAHIIKKLEKIKLTENIKRESVTKIISGLLYMQGFSSKLDYNPYYLNVKNGIIDLRTGEIRERVPEDYCTFFIDIKYKGLKKDTSHFDKFFDDITLNDQAYKKYLQKFLGYSITGLTKENIFAVFYGPGGDGKTKLFNLIEKVLQNYYHVMDAEAMIETGAKVSAGACTPHLTGIERKRFSCCDESERDAKMNISKVKFLTGGANKINIVPKFKEQRKIIPEFQLVLGTNHLPQAKGGADGGLARRMMIFPFLAEFKPQSEFKKTNPRHRLANMEIEEELTEVIYEFLTWLVNGSVQYFKYGLKNDVPDIIKKYTNKYLTDNNHIKTFITENCNIAPDKYVSTSELWLAFKVTCYDCTAVHFGRIFCEFMQHETQNDEYTSVTRRINGKVQRIFPGIELKDDDEIPEEVAHPQVALSNAKAKYSFNCEDLFIDDDDFKKMREELSSARPKSTKDLNLNKCLFLDSDNESEEEVPIKNYKPIKKMRGIYLDLDNL